MKRALVLGLVGVGPLLIGGCAAVRPVDPLPLVPTPPIYRSDVPTPAPRPASSGDRLLPADPGPPGSTASTDPAPPEGAPEAPSPSARPLPAPNRFRAEPWWTAFADPALDSVMNEAMHHNYNLRDVRTLIYENDLAPDIPRGPLWPLRINAPVTLQHVNGATPPGFGDPGYTSDYSDLSIGLQASYRLDVFGQLDMQRRSIEDLVHEQAESTEANAQNLAEQVAQLWFEVLEQRALLDLLTRQTDYGENLLTMVKARFEQHLTPRLVVLQQEQLLLAIRAQVPLSVAAIALLNSRLSVLLGRTPNPNVDIVPLDRQLPELPPAPPVGTPADLVRTVPEVKFAQIRATEAEHQKSLNLSGWLPEVELFAGGSSETYNFDQTFFTAAAGVRLIYPVFDGGQRITRDRQVNLTVARRIRLYQLAVDTAVQHVQDALVQEKKQAENVRTLQTQVELGRSVLQEARALFEQGGADFLPVLQALNELVAVERASLSARRLLLSYRITLYHSLGGTWSRAVTKYYD